ncbi:MAG: thioredoxin family protein [Crocinitomicaceae bacterium]
MSLVESNMMDLGTKAPDFKLLDTISGSELSLDDLKTDKATVIAFICNHCPFVLHINSALVKVANEYQAKGIQFIAISSNSVKTHPQDGPEYMAKQAKKEQYPFPYLYDKTQEVAKAYKAECTPDFFVFDDALKCVYRGRFDETRPNIGQATGADIASALDTILAGGIVDSEQWPSMGCNIKWE